MLLLIGRWAERLGNKCRVSSLVGGAMSRPNECRLVVVIKATPNSRVALKRIATR